MARPCFLAFSPSSFFLRPCTKASSSLRPRIRPPCPESGSAHYARIAAGPAHHPWTATGVRGAGRSGRSQTPEREGDPLRSYGKVVPSSWSFPLWFLGCAGQCPGFFPSSEAFAAHQVPPAPGRHGAAAGAQEVTNAGSGEREEGGGRRAGAARPGGTVTASPNAGPGAGPAGVWRQVPVPGRVCAPAEGARGEADGRLPRGRPRLARVESRWALPGSPWPDSRGGQSFPSWQVHEARET